jgi:tagaturonate epimerase
MRLINEDEDQALAPDKIVRSVKTFSIGLLKIYPRSFCSKNGLWYGLIRTSEGKKFSIMGERRCVLKDVFQGNCHHQLSSLKLCDLSAQNTEALMELFPYTKPVSLGKYPVTIGTGDLLGMAAPGHIRVIRRFRAHPVLAQQSAVENIQTGRNFTQAIQDAAWAVFQENYQEGYGADANHLKSLQEVRSALNAGASMVTLDLSEKIHPEALHEPKELVDRKFHDEIDEGDAKVIFHLFLDKEFVFRGTDGQFSIQFDEESVKRNTLLFCKALDFTEEVYEWIRFRQGNQGSIDIEISMDKTPFPTSRENHFFFALALSHRGVHIQSLAPRFTKELQKGFNDHGDREAFRRSFYQHALIAQEYGNYKISIHSGSDNFSPFSDAEGLSKGFLHLKTSGTDWFEAMRLIALRNPSLYRETHSFARSRFKELSKLNHVTTDPSRIPSLERLSDEELPGLLDREDFRQVLHITYGYLLNATDGAGRNLFRDHLTHTLIQYEEDYWSLLETHIEKQLSSLGIEKKRSQTL